MSRSSSPETQPWYLGVDAVVEGDEGDRKEIFHQQACNWAPLPPQALSLHPEHSPTYTSLYVGAEIEHKIAFLNELEQKEPIAGLLNELLFDSRHLLVSMDEQQILDFINTLRGIGMDEVVCATLRKAQADCLRARPTLSTTSSSNSTARSRKYSLITSIYPRKNHWLSSCMNLSCSPALHNGCGKVYASWWRDRTKCWLANA